MHLLIGLGNPGRDYAGTRHNVGFLFLDYLADRLGVGFTERKWQAECATARIAGEKVLLAKPQTYMNRSGESVGRLASYFRIEPRCIVVVHDDLDLPPGRIKIVANRGDGGHNGVKSIAAHLQSREFARFRIGIGRPENEEEAKDFVLRNFRQAEEDLLREQFPVIHAGIEIFIQNGLVAAMNHLNGAARKKD